MAELIPSNNARGLVDDNPLADDDTTLNLQTGQGSLFSDPGGDVVRAIITDGNESIYEVITITDRTTDALTITRGEEGTTALEWPQGSKVAEVLTQDGLQNLLYRTTVIPITLNTPDPSGNSTYWIDDHDGVFDVGVWQYISGVDAIVNGLAFVPPVSDASATVIIAIGYDGGSQTARMRVDHLVASDGEDIDDATWVTGTAQDLAFAAADYTLKIAEFSISDLESQALLFVSVINEGAHGNDTMGDPFTLYGAWLRYRSE